MVNPVARSRRGATPPVTSLTLRDKAMSRKGPAARAPGFHHVALLSFATATNAPPIPRARLPVDSMICADDWVGPRTARMAARPQTASAFVTSRLEEGLKGVDATGLRTGSWRETQIRRGLCRIERKLPVAIRPRALQYSYRRSRFFLLLLGVARFALRDTRFGAGRGPVLLFPGMSTRTAERGGEGKAALEDAFSTNESLPVAARAFSTKHGAGAGGGGSISHRPRRLRGTETNLQRIRSVSAFGIHERRSGGGSFT